MFSSTLHRTESHNAENTVDFGSTSNEATVDGKIFSYMDFPPHLNNICRKWRENGNPAANLRTVLEALC